MKLAIIGSGISGLGAAYVLSRAHDVEVFERAARAGGHTRTIHHEGPAPPEHLVQLPCAFCSASVTTAAAEAPLALLSVGAGLNDRRGR